MSRKKPKNRACKGNRQGLVSPTFLDAAGAAGGRYCRGAPPSQIESFMAVRIRLKRVGAKNAPYYRIVVADARSPRDGKFIEEIGSYQPLKKGDNCKIDLDRAKYWVSHGAQPSETVASFIKKLSKAAVPA
jgi:small subunit ribosomal protein S16